jgi:hypothetical protein
MAAAQEIEGWDALLGKVRDKRRRIAVFTDRVGPRGAYLTNIGIVASAVATLLTAGPAIGGLRLTQALGSAGDNSPSWRILCAIAALCSLASTIATNLFRSHDIASRLARAQACDAKLESLELLVELKQLTLKEATARYDKCLPEISFLPAELAPRRRLGKAPALDSVGGCIGSPVANQTVDASFTCSGEISGLQAGVHLWLAIEVAGRLWPKEGEIVALDDGSWSKTIFEEGDAGRFSLSLWAVNAAGDKAIRAWLEECERSGEYAELHRLPGMRRLARVDGLHRELVGQEVASDGKTA